MTGAGETGAPTVDVVIPVYNAPDDVERCVASVLAHTGGGYRLILIDDASPDPRVGDVFARLRARGLPQLTLLANETNLGFTGTANRGLRLSDNDVVLLNSDTEVTAGWLDALARCAASSPHVGTITPWSNNAEICSYPRFCADNAWPEGADPEPVRAALAATAVPTYPLLPTGVGFCLYVKRELIDAIGVFDPAFGRGYGEENDFCLRAHRAGYWNVLCDDAFVLHLGGRSFVGEKARLSPKNTAILLARHPDYAAIVGDYIARDPLRPLRDAAQTRQRARDGRAGILHVLHHHGGGTEHHVRALIDASRDDWRHCLAIAVGDHWQVEEHLDDGGRAHLRVRRAARTRRWGAFVGGTRGNVRRRRRPRPPDLDVPRAAARRAAVAGPAVRHHRARPRPRLPDDDDDRSPTASGAARAATSAPASPAPATGDPVAWRERHRAFVAGASFVIAPSRWAADTFGAFFPVAVDVIAHGAPGVWARAASTADRTAPPPPAGPVSAVLLPADDVPTVAIVGAIGPDKGARRIEALTALARSRGANLRFVVIGYLDRQSGPWQSDDARLTVHGRYDANALPRLLDHYRAALVAYPSHGPETFSFTLSEVWAAGRAVVVPPIGALRERVAGTGAGLRADRFRMARRRGVPRPADRAARFRRGGRRCARRAWPRARSRSRRSRRWPCAPSPTTARALAAAPPGAWPPLAPVRVRDALGYEPWWMPNRPSPTPGATVAPAADPSPALATRDACRGSRPRHAHRECGAAPAAHGARPRAVPARARAAGRRAEGEAALMATPPFAQWLARGRAHQWEGRPVDAMLCFRQAARLEPRAPDARFHLGEVLWQLGRLPAAVAAWREATAVAPAHVAAWTAIAEASLAGGDYPAAREASLRVLALTPDDARADAIAGIASLAAGGDGATVRIAAAFERMPALTGVPTVAGPLALVIAAAPTPDTDALVAALALRLAAPEMAKTTAPLLLALAAESAAIPALLDHAAARGYAPGDHDALRRLARVAYARDAGLTRTAGGGDGDDSGASRTRPDLAGAAGDAGVCSPASARALALHYARSATRPSRRRCRWSGRGVPRVRRCA